MGSAGISQDEEFEALQYHAKTLIARIHKAAEKRKGVRLSSFDCHALANTMFIEDPFAWEEYDVDFD